MADEKDYGMKIINKKNPEKNFEKRDWSHVNCAIAGTDYKKTILQMEKEAKDAGEKYDRLKASYATKGSGLSEIFAASAKSVHEAELTYQIKEAKLNFLHGLIAPASGIKILGNKARIEQMVPFIFKTAASGLPNNGADIETQEKIFDGRTLKILNKAYEAVGGEGNNNLPEPLKKYLNDKAAAELAEQIRLGNNLSQVGDC